MSAPRIACFSDLVAMLTADGVSYEASPENQFVLLATEINDVEGHQLIRWQPEEAAIQFIQSIPVPMHDAAMPALESAVVRLNHAMAWAGVSIDHANRVLSYRLTLSLLPGGDIAPEVIRAGFRIAVNTGADVTPTLRRVAAGEIEPADAVADAARVLAARR